MSKLEWEEATSEEIHIIRAEEDGLYLDLHQNVNNDAPYLGGAFFTWKELWTLLEGEIKP